MSVWLERIFMRRIIPVVLFIVAGLLPINDVLAEPPAAIYKSSNDFSDVVEALKFAIEDHGLFINNVMHMGDMLERTGKDLGFEKPVYLRAESFEFCSALLSRRMLQEDPARIVNCPFIISVYVLPDQPDTTYLAHRILAKPGEQGIMGEIAATLKEIATSAAEGW